MIVYMKLINASLVRQSCSDDSVIKVNKRTQNNSELEEVYLLVDLAK